MGILDPKSRPIKGGEGVPHTHLVETVSPKNRPQKMGALKIVPKIMMNMSIPRVELRKTATKFIGTPGVSIGGMLPFCTLDA